jgi:hypothetical protein
MSAFFILIQPCFLNPNIIHSGKKEGAISSSLHVSHSVIFDNDANLRVRKQSHLLI